MAGDGDGDGETDVKMNEKNRIEWRSEGKEENVWYIEQKHPSLHWQDVVCQS